MKKVRVKIFPALTCLLVMLLTFSTLSNAQLREDLSKSSDFMGPVIKEGSSQGGSLSNLFNMQMNHSYSMTFASIGGQYQNVNAYTNTMHFFFTDNLTGRLDLSLLHSPFGNSFLDNGNGMGTEFIIRNAELNYQISDRSNISIQFQQLPSYGMNPWSRSPFYDPFYSGSNFRNY